MPTYKFRNKKTNEEHEEFMSLSSLENFLKENEDIIQMPSSPAIISGGSGKKPDDSFRDILRNIKKEHSRGITSSTVNTF